MLYTVYHYQRQTTTPQINDSRVSLRLETASETAERTRSQATKIVLFSILRDHNSRRMPLSTSCMCDVSGAKSQLIHARARAAEECRCRQCLIDIFYFNCVLPQPSSCFEMQWSHAGGKTQMTFVAAIRMSVQSEQNGMYVGFAQYPA